MAKLPRGVGRQLAAALPRKSGGSLTGHPIGMNQRKGTFTHMEGVPGMPRKPQAVGLSSSTAPHKSEMQFFNASFGTTGNSGRT